MLPVPACSGHHWSLVLRPRPLSPSRQNPDRTQVCICVRTLPGPTSHPRVLEGTTVVVSGSDPSEPAPVAPAPSLTSLGTGGSRWGRETLPEPRRRRVTAGPVRLRARGTLQTGHEVAGP